VHKLCLSVIHNSILQAVTFLSHPDHVMEFGLGWFSNWLSHPAEDLKAVERAVEALFVSSPRNLIAVFCHHEYLSVGLKEIPGT